MTLRHSRALSSDSSFLRAQGLSGVDALGLATAALLVLAFFPPLMFDNWTSRLAVMAVGGVVGSLFVVRGALAWVPSALAALAFLAVGLVASLLGGAARSSVVGDAGRETSWAIVALSFGLWGLGRGMGARAREVLPAVALVALAVHAAVGIAQVVVGVDSGPLALYFRRPTGFVANPVYFGALCAGGAVVGVALRATGWRTAVPMVVCGHAAALSGSRVAVGSVVVVTLAIVAVRRTRPDVVAGALAFTALLSGVLLARWRTPSADLASRISAGDGGGRTQIWIYGVQAWTDRPLLGFGLGRFRPATQGKFTAEFVARFAADERTQAWFDPHNIGVNLLVSTGVIGTLVLLAWFVYAVRGISGPLPWAVLAIAITWTLQPVGIATLPLVMLLFGASHSGAASPAPRRLHLGAAATVGAALSIWLVTADVILARAASEFDMALAATAGRLYPHDPVVADLVAQIGAFDATATVDEVERWRLLPTRWDPDRPLWWVRLAEFQIRGGDFSAAQRSIERALDEQPYNAGAVRAGLRLAVAQQDQLQLVTWLERACELSMPECESGAS